jgi:hypothetical protein
MSNVVRVIRLLYFTLRTIFPEYSAGTVLSHGTAWAVATFVIIRLDRDRQTTNFELNSMLKLKKNVNR